MSTITSPILEISRLKLEPIPTNKILRDAKVCRVEGVTVIVDKYGTIYSPQVTASRAYPYKCGLEATLKGAARLGILSKSALKQHTDMVAKERARDAEYHAARSIADQAKVLGLKLTNAQMGRLQRALNQF